MDLHPKNKHLLRIESVSRVYHVKYSFLKKQICWHDLYSHVLFKGHSDHYWVRRQGATDVDWKNHRIVFLSIRHLLLCSACCE